MSTNNLSRIDTALAEEQRQQLLRAKQAKVEELQAEIASLSSLCSSTPTPLSAISTYQHQHHRSLINKLQRRTSHAIPRSMSSNGAPTMSRHSSTDRIELPPQRPRALSQRSAPSMARNGSRGTSSQRSGNLPFIQTGNMPPPLNAEPRRDNPSMTAWATQDGPYNSYTYNQPQLQRTMSQRKPDLEQVPEMDHGLEDPGDFIARSFGGTSIVAISPSISIPSSATLTNHRLSVGSYNMPTPSTPTGESLTTATTFTSNNMSRSNSRQNSLYNESLLGGMQMMNVDSRNSFSTDLNDPSLYDQVTHIPSSRHLRRSSNEEQSQLLMGAGGASHESQFSLPFQMSSGQFGEKMEKSQSNESTSSSSSKSSSRNVQRLQDQIQLAAKRTLMPKGGSEESTSMSRENSSQSMTRVDSKDGSQDKVAISSKPTYQRPKHDRVFCKQCDNHQEGFRGEHELRRHQDREHKEMVKKWQCIDPTAMGPDGQDHPKPVIPLSRCKACNHQKKRYGAYYNAAAHLRRSHFKPKAKGRSKNTKVEDVEKRGGKGGGDWPPMSELKYWMKEVEEPAVSMTDAQQAAADLAEASDEDILDIDDQTFSQQSMSTISNDFEMNLLDPSSPILNIFPAAVNNDMFGLSSNMTLDLSGAGGQGQCMDMFSGQNAGGFPPMPLDFSDGNGVNEQFYQNDAAAMGYLTGNEGVMSTHHGFEEQILSGQGFVHFSY